MAASPSTFEKPLTDDDHRPLRPIAHGPASPRQSRRCGGIVDLRATGGRPVAGAGRRPRHAAGRPRIGGRDPTRPRAIRAGVGWRGGVAIATNGAPRRTALYEDALETLRSRGLVFDCACSRAD